MIKAIAIPARLLKDNLSAEEQEELNMLYSLAPMSNEEIEARQAELGLAESERLAKLPSFLSSKRRERVDNGFLFEGKRFYTDTASIAALTATRMITSSSPSYQANWKTPEGFVTLDAAKIVEVSNRALAFVQTCFDAENAVLSKIASGQTVTEESIEIAFENELAVAGWGNT